MSNKHFLMACALLVASATGAAADSYWPAKITGTWKGVSNQSPIVLKIVSQSTGSKCENIAGSLHDVNGGFTNQVTGYYCPASGAFQFMRYPANSNVAFQVYSGNLSQANPPQSETILMAGSFGQYSQAFGPLGQYSFSLTK